VDGVFARKWVELWVGRKVLAARTVADGVDAREWVEMGGEKKPLGMSEPGCVDGCGRRGCKGVAGNGWGEEAAGERQEWLVCSHDATYQVLFSAIGQVPVQQKQGEFHAVTRFSGAVPGFSPAQFRAAIAEVLLLGTRSSTFSLIALPL